MKSKKVAVIIFVLISIFVLRNSITSITSLLQNEGAVQDLQQELSEKKKEHIFLTQRLSQVKTDEFVEREAREKLGMVQENEHPVFVIPPSEKNNENKVDKKENWEKWKEIFRF